MPHGPCEGVWGARRADKRSGAQSRARDEIRMEGWSGEGGPGSWRGFLMWRSAGAQCQPQLPLPLASESPKCLSAEGPAAGPDAGRSVSCRGGSSSASSSPRTTPGLPHPRDYTSKSLELSLGPSVAAT